MLRLAFKVNSKGFFSRIIRFVSKSQDGVTHVEIVFPDNLSFSSREPRGTGYLYIDYLKDPDDWLIIDMPEMAPEKIDAIRRKANSMLGLPYGWGDLGGYYFNRDIWDTAGIFCSGAITELMHAAGEFLSLKPNRTSPQRMLDVARVRFGEPRRPNDLEKLA